MTAPPQPSHQVGPMPRGFEPAIPEAPKRQAPLTGKELADYEVWSDNLPMCWLCNGTKKIHEGAEDVVTQPCFGFDCPSCHERDGEKNTPIRDCPVCQAVPRLVKDLRAARAALRDYGVAADHLDHARRNRRWMDCDDYFVMLSAADKKARAALPSEEPERCERCGWPLETDTKKGCVRGNCSQRPLPPLPTDPKIREKRLLEAMAVSGVEKLPESVPSNTCPKCHHLVHWTGGEDGDWECNDPACPCDCFEWCVEDSSVR